MMGFNEDDLNFLYHLSSLKEAVILSATCPVAIPETIQLHGISFLTYSLYHAAEDKSRALDLMRLRIRNYRKDLENHHAFHSGLVEQFYTVDSALSSDSRERFVEATRIVLAQTLAYSYLVKIHQDFAEGDSFLEYPSCNPVLSTGYLFAPQGFDLARGKSFNPLQSFENVGTDISDMGTLLSDFENREARLPAIKLDDHQDLGGETIDSSLRGRVELNKTLLERLGFYV